jgi:hypothetical protein
MTDIPENGGPVFGQFDERRNDSSRITCQVNYLNKILFSYKRLLFTISVHVRNGAGINYKLMDVMVYF